MLFVSARNMSRLVLPIMRKTRQPGHSSRFRKRHSRNSFLRLVFYGLISASCLIAAQSRSAESNPPRILFLHVRAIADRFELVDAKVTSGQLKALKYDSTRKGVHFELIADTDSEVLFRDVCPEPTIRRLEYEDPSHPGNIIAKQIVYAAAEFTIRVPYFAKARRVRFYRPLAGSSPPGLTERKSMLSLAGEIVLPPNIE